MILVVPCLVPVPLLVCVRGVKPRGLRDSEGNENLTLLGVCTCEGDESLIPWVPLGVCKELSDPDKRRDNGNGGLYPKELGEMSISSAYFGFDVVLLVENELLLFFRGLSLFVLSISLSSLRTCMSSLPSLFEPFPFPPPSPQ